MHKSSHREIRPLPDRTSDSDIQTPALPSSKLQIGSNLASNHPFQTRTDLHQVHASGVGFDHLYHGSPRHGAFTESSMDGPLGDLQSQKHTRVELQRAPQRRSHTKSRTGCFTCKDRRIKCDENHPICDQCNRRRLKCVWPHIQNRNFQGALQRLFSRSPVPAPLQTPHATFTMQDFRLFHHFIESAYPHHPLGNDSIWTHEVPSISHNHDYLLHAMLGLSASEISMTPATSSDLTCSAMSHRVKSIKSLNQALSDGIHTDEDGNAMLATCYTLLFQSALIDDGVSEFMSFLRGILIVATNMGCRNMKFMFHSFLGSEQAAQMEPHLDGGPGVNVEFIKAACRSLEAFSSLCQKNYEKTYHGAILKTARALFTSSREAYLGLREIYTTFSVTMTHEEFQDFINLENEVGQLLQAHFVAVQLLLSPITINELGPRKPLSLAYGHGGWLDTILERSPRHMMKYYAWPLSISKSLHEGGFYKELMTSSRTLSPDTEDMNENNTETEIAEDLSV